MSLIETAPQQYESDRGCSGKSGVGSSLLRNTTSKTPRGVVQPKVACATRILFEDRYISFMTKLGYILIVTKFGYILIVTKFS
jgi:hypothetical protein